MPKFRVTYIVEAYNLSAVKYSAHMLNTPNLEILDRKCSKVRGPSGKRKNYLIVRDGVTTLAYLGLSSKSNATESIKELNRLNPHHVYTIKEA